jgi:L-alanine-DL-glutamate epimerase-like enolase superfamily enzyme
MRTYTYNIPIHSHALSVRHREGIIFESNNGLAEAAPLPGNHAHDLAMEFAIASLSIPFPTHYPHVKIAALVFNEKEAIEAIDQGFQTIKIKVKKYSVQDAVDLIKKLQEFPCQLRIDINRHWNRDETLYFFKNIEPRNIEFIEEPSYFFDSLPIAVDESLFLSDRSIDDPSIEAFVLKPTLLGGKINHWIQMAKSLKKKLVFSSSFESEIALIHIARLQSIYEPSIAAGIDTSRAFVHHLLPFPIKNGQLQPKKIPPLDRRWLSEFVY